MTPVRRAVASRWRRFDTLVVMTVVALASLPYLAGFVTTGVLGYNSGLATIPTSGLLGFHPGLPWLDPNVGFVSQALGHLSAMDIIHGRIGWWNPYEGVGVPLVGEGQSAALFPLTPLLALANGQLYFHLALELIAGIATQRLLKEMGMARWVTVVGGILFGLNGTFAWLTNAAFNPVAFLPVVLWGIERARHRSVREGWSGWLLIAAGLVLSVYAGFPETAYIDGALAAAWAVVRLVQQPSGRRAGYAATVGLGGVVGLAVSAPFFAAFAAATSHADLGGHSGTFATAHLPVQAVSTLGLPYLYGPLYGFNASVHGTTLHGLWGSVGGFVSAALLTVAFLGLFAGRDRGIRGLLVVWIGIVLAKSFGVGPVVHLVNLLPGISATAFSRYAPPSWEMAFVVLAALGLQSVGEPATPSRRVRTAVAAAAIASLLAVGAELLAANGLLRALQRQTGFADYPIEAVVWALVTVVVLAIVGLAARPALARWGMGAVLVVDGLIMFMVPELSAPGRIPVDLAPITFLQEHLGLYRFATLGPVVPNYGSYFGIAEVNAHDLPLPGAWATFVRQNLETNERPQQFDGVTSVSPTGLSPVEELRRHVTSYEAIGVKYVVAPAGWQDVPGRLVFRDRQTWIWELPSPTPFYRVLSGSCTLDPISYDSLRTSCTRPSEVVRNELDLPGWAATTNGVPARLTPVRPLFSTVRVPAGASVVNFTYVAPHMGIATAAAGGGIALVAGAMTVPLLSRRRRRHSRAAHAAGTRRWVGPTAGSPAGQGLAAPPPVYRPPTFPTPARPVPVYRPPVPGILQPGYQLPRRAPGSQAPRGIGVSTRPGNGNGSGNGNGNGRHVAGNENGNGNGAANGHAPAHAPASRRLVSRSTTP